MNVAMRDKLEKGLSENLGSLSVVITEVLSILDQRDVDLSSLEQRIAKDQGLSARILRIANSPFYGMSRQIASLKEATVVLGVHTIRNVVTTAGVMALFSGEEESRFDRLAFWQHAIGTGVASKVVGNHCRLEGETAFTAGLLHDVGKLVMDTVMTEEFHRALQLARERGCLLLEAEREVMGFDHAYAGALAAERWKLPGGVTLAIRDHHRPAETEDDLAAVVHIGDIFCRSLDIGNGGDDTIPALDPRIWERMRFEWADVRRCLGEIEQLNMHSNLFL